MRWRGRRSICPTGIPRVRIGFEPSATKPSRWTRDASPRLPRAEGRPIHRRWAGPSQGMFHVALPLRLWGPQGHPEPVHGPIREGEFRMRLRAFSADQGAYGPRAQGRGRRARARQDVETCFQSSRAADPSLLESDLFSLAPRRFGSPFGIYVTEGTFQPRRSRRHPALERSCRPTYAPRSCTLLFLEEELEHVCAGQRGAEAGISRKAPRRSVVGPRHGRLASSRISSSSSRVSISRRRSVPKTRLAFSRNVSTAR